MCLWPCQPCNRVSINGDEKLKCSKIFAVAAPILLCSPVPDLEFTQFVTSSPSERERRERECCSDNWRINMIFLSAKGLARNQDIVQHVILPYTRLQLRGLGSLIIAQDAQRWILSADRTNNRATDLEPSHSPTAPACRRASASSRNPCICLWSVSSKRDTRVGKSCVLDKGQCCLLSFFLFPNIFLLAVIYQQLTLLRKWEVGANGNFGLEIQTCKL